MGGKQSLTSAFSANSSSTPPLPPSLHDELTDADRLIVQRTWRHLVADSGDAGNAKMNELGVRIFLRIFELEPTVREAFPQFGELATSQQLAKDVVFRCHARRFVRAVQSVVEQLQALDVFVVPNLHILGRKHRGLHGFRPEYLSTFETAMEDVWKQELGGKFDRQARRAWRKVFRLITSTLLEGYGDGPEVNGVSSCEANCEVSTADVR